MFDAILRCSLEFFFFRNYRWYLCSPIYRMLIYIRSVLGCLRKVGCVLSVKKVWGMKLHFLKGKGSRSDLQVAVSGWENKVMGTEHDKKVLWKVDPKGKSFVHKYMFSWDVELPLIMDFKFLYLWSDLFCVYLWNLCYFG